MRALDANQLAVIGALAVTLGLYAPVVLAPDAVYCEDLAVSHVPKAAAMYRAPFDASRGLPSPSLLMGTASLSGDGELLLPAALPVVAAALSTVAPDEPRGLLRFEWAIGCLCVLVGLLSTRRLLVVLGATPLLAFVGGLSYVLCGTVIGLWHHVSGTRGTLLLPAALLALSLAARRWTPAAWGLFALATVACLGMSAEVYWAAGLVALWSIAQLPHARRAFAERGAAALVWPSLAGVLVLVVLLPPYLLVTSERGGFARALEDPALWYAYASLGSQWQSPSTLLHAFYGLPSIALVGLSVVGGAAAVSLRRGGAPAEPWPRLASGSTGEVIASAIAAAGGVLAVLAAGPLVEALARSSRGAPPAVLATHLHTPYRTFGAVAVWGSLVLATLGLSVWCRAQLSARTRALHVGVGLALLVVPVALGAGRFVHGGVEGSAPALRAAEAFGLVAVLAVSVAMLRAPGRGGVAARAALVALVVAIGCGTLARSHANVRRSGEQLDLLRVHAEMVERAPRALAGLRRFRMASVSNTTRPLCFFVDAACVDGYSAHAVPVPLLALLERARIVRPSLLYTLDPDWRRLRALGLADMLGIRYWLITGPGRAAPKGPAFDFLPDAGTLLTAPEGPPRAYGVRLVETPSAFDKAWPLERLHGAPGLAEVVALLEQLGPTGRLRHEGVLFQADLARVPSAARGGEVSVLEAERHRVRLAVRSVAGTVVATSEILAADWRAHAGTEALPIVPVNGILLGAIVPPGAHEVSFERAAAR